MSLFSRSFVRDENGYLLFDPVDGPLREGEVVALTDGLENLRHIVKDERMGLPTEAKSRKNVPIYSGVLMYFPNAIAAVAACSHQGNEQHNPGTPLHWDRDKSGDEHDALTRHLMEAGTIDTDGIRHSAKVAWRALAALEKEIEGSS